MRPIDADALLEKVLDIPPYCGHCDGYGFVQLDMVEDAIKDAPTIEAEPVKHGRWIEHTAVGENMAGEIIEIVISCNCSECGFDGGYHANYCHNCGCKMDLED